MRDDDSPSNEFWKAYVTFECGTATGNDAKLMQSINTSGIHRNEKRRSIHCTCMHWIQNRSIIHFPIHWEITIWMIGSWMWLHTKTHPFSLFFIVIMVFAIFQKKKMKKKLSDWLMAFFCKQSTFNFRFNVLIKIQPPNSWILPESFCVHVSCLMNDRVYEFEFNVISNFFLQSILHLMQQVNFPEFSEKASETKKPAWHDAWQVMSILKMLYISLFVVIIIIVIVIASKLDWIVWCHLPLELILCFNMLNCHILINGSAMVVAIIAVMPTYMPLLAHSQMTHSIDALGSFFCLAITKNANDLHL